MTVCCHLTDYIAAKGLNKRWITRIPSTRYPQHSKLRHSIHICRLRLCSECFSPHSGYMSISISPQITEVGIAAEPHYQQPMLDSPLHGEEQPLHHLAVAMADSALSPKQFGKLGEQYATAWLEQQGWHTLSRNWHTRYGELDIVMMTPDRTIVFVEVKSRRNVHYGIPQEAVTRAKQTNLRRAACEWLIDSRNRIPHSGIRFDVITIVLSMGSPTVHHIAGAF